MAKYDVKMSCGHTETVELFGKSTDRDSKIKWLEQHGKCSNCKRAEAEVEGLGLHCMTYPVPDQTGSVWACLVVTGAATYEHRSEIKAAGYSWDCYRPAALLSRHEMIADKTLRSVSDDTNPAQSYERTGRAWSKCCPVSEIGSEIERLQGVVTCPLHIYTKAWSEMTARTAAKIADWEAGALDLSAYTINFLDACQRQEADRADYWALQGIKTLLGAGNAEKRQQLKDWQQLWAAEIEARGLGRCEMRTAFRD